MFCKRCHLKNLDPSLMKIGKPKKTFRIKHKFVGLKWTCMWKVQRHGITIFQISHAVDNCEKFSKQSSIWQHFGIHFKFCNWIILQIFTSIGQCEKCVKMLFKIHQCGNKKVCTKILHTIHVVQYFSHCNIWNIPCKVM